MQANRGTASRKAVIRNDRQKISGVIVITFTVIFFMVGLALYSNLEARSERHQRGESYRRHLLSSALDEVKTGYKIILAAAEAKVEKQEADHAAWLNSIAVQQKMLAEQQVEADRQYKDTLYAAKAEGEKPITGGVPDIPDPVQGKGESVEFESTCYCLSGTTASGAPVGRGIIAVDPSVIPLGTRVYVSGYGYAIAADTGGAIKGHIIDVWLPTYQECIDWGRRMVTVTF